MEIQCIRKQDIAYPEALRQYDRMPPQLFVLGELPDPRAKRVAIVGARGCSAYGKREALRFAGALAACGVQVISGMAKGIDSWAHIGALEAGGKTFAIVGNGVDICYPPSHRVLYEKIREQGGILSEFAPGTPAMPYHFPLRNRIISALADLVLVVEARRKSGSLITVSYALEQGKSVYAVPGKNTDALSEGCNQLLADGAAVAWGPEALLMELGLRERKAEKEEGAQCTLPPDWAKQALYRKTWEALSGEEKSLDRLQAETGLSPSELSLALMQLCLRGYATEAPGQFYLRK